MIRSFVRYAVSSIVYHRLSLPSAQKEVVNDANTASTSSSMASSSLTTASNSSEEDKRSIQRKDVVEGAAKSKSSNNAFDSFYAAFKTNAFCGEGLKYMDAVSEKGKIVNIEVYKISQWTEKGLLSIMASLDQETSRPNHSVSSQLCFLTSVIRSFSDDRSGEVVELTQVHALEIFTFDFFKQVKDSSGGQSQTKSLLKEIQRALQSITASLEKEKTLQSLSNVERTIVSTNMTLMTNNEEICTLFSPAQKANPLSDIKHRYSRLFQEQQFAINDIESVDSLRSGTCDSNLEEMMHLGQETFDDATFEAHECNQLKQTISKVSSQGKELKITRDYVVLDHLHTDDMLPLFPNHLVQVDQVTKTLELQYSLEKNTSTSKEKNSTALTKTNYKSPIPPVLTPMKNTKIRTPTRSKDSHWSHTQLLSTTQTDCRKYTPSHSGEKRKRSLFITPKNGRGSKRRDRTPVSGTSTVPTVVVPLSSGKRSTLEDSNSHALSGRITSLSPLRKKVFL